MCTNLAAAEAVYSMNTDAAAAAAAATAATAEAATADD